ncbi:hypothetical protein, partial [Candidatus Electronema sp. TJ]|uniref:hypothetical protein n=1 Tax=Candidatus Electronema sp. TJ TaxID=3401573 RepID=UPI003AA89CD9
AGKEEAGICLFFYNQRLCGLRGGRGMMPYPLRSLLTFQRKPAIKVYSERVCARALPARFHMPLNCSVTLFFTFFINPLCTGEPPCPWIPPNTLTGKSPKPLKAA